MGSVVDRGMEGCETEEGGGDGERASGGVRVSAQDAIGNVEALVPKGVPAIPLAFSGADEQLKLLQKLYQPSIIAVVSVSEVFLRTARSLLAPAIGQRHTLREFRFPLESPAVLSAADVVFADSF